MNILLDHLLIDIVCLAMLYVPGMIVARRFPAGIRSAGIPAIASTDTTTLLRFAVASEQYR
jgi:hypothetical protein